MAREMAERLPLSDWRQFADILAQTPRNTAYALGRLREDFPDGIKIVVLDDQTADLAEGAARSKENISYEQGRSGFVLLDHDAKGMPAAVRAKIDELGGFLAALEHICPGLTAAGYIRRLSTSSGVYREDTGETFQKLGEHVYLLAKDGADSKRFFYTLHDRAWANGLGWHIISKSGGLLERSIIDRSVCAGERLVFEASPDLEPPLAQKRPQPEVQHGEPFDSKAKCLALTSEEKRARQAALDDSEKVLAPEAEKIRRKFIAEKIASAMKRGASREAAERTAQNWAKGVLLPDAVLDFSNHGLGEVLVRDVLANPAPYEGKWFADPIEGSSYSRSSAILRQGRMGVSVLSFAHGLETVYRLRHDFASIEAAILAADKSKALCTLCELAPNAELDPAERAELVKLAADRFSADLLECAASDPGAPHELEAVTELALLKINSPPEFHRLWAKLKALKNVGVGDLKKLVDKEVKAWEKEAAPPRHDFAEGDRPGFETNKSLEDFVAYLPAHDYIYTPTREHWPAVSVNASLPPVAVGTSQSGEAVMIPASTWLDAHNCVEQMIWAPGQPMLIKDKLVSKGGWIEREGTTMFNSYMPPTIEAGDKTQAGPWVEHAHKVFGDDADHIIKYSAAKVQFPDVKINHALVLGGAQGVGKDTLLEPLKYAVGPCNFEEVGPHTILNPFTGFLKAVILRVSEANDLGDSNRFDLYERMKTITASPPDVLRVNEKHLREYYIFNCCGVIITTNHKTGGIYLPADDRRHFVAWSDLTKEDFTQAYWEEIWEWYAQGGVWHVAAYLRELDISSFNPKAPPPRTQAFWDIVEFEPRA